MVSWSEIKDSLCFVSPEENQSHIVTGYYVNLMKYVKHQYKPISISLYMPERIKIREMSFFKPTKSILSDWKEKRITEDEYINSFYNLVLSKFTAEQIYNHIKEKYKSHPVVLLCYEKPFSFCHRHIISHWLSQYTKDTLGFSVKELQIN